MCICVYVYMCICVYVYMCICVYVYMCICVYVYMCIGIDIDILILIYSIYISVNDTISQLRSSGRITDDPMNF